MIASKTRLFLAVAALFVAIYAIGCNDNSGKGSAKASDNVDTTKMDTASTRPVKTTNQ